MDHFGNVSSQLLPPSSSLDGIPSGPNRPSVVFLDHSGEESTKDRSRVNINEAHIVCGVIEDILIQNPVCISFVFLLGTVHAQTSRQNLKGSDIGIIAPYVAQISLLTRLLNTDAKYRERFEARLGQRANQLSQIEIKTVDGFEGREKEVVIFSTVRNNSTGHIGFLADRRRLNVGLTRAKRGLFVVGNLETLRAGKRGKTEGGSLGKGWIGLGR